MIGQGFNWQSPGYLTKSNTLLKTGEPLPPPGIEQRVEVCKTHLDKSIAWKGAVVGILEMRRHYSNYFKRIGSF